MNLTLEEAVRLHRELWKRVAEEIPGSNAERVYDLKYSSLVDMGFDPDAIKNRCFMCEYAKRQVLDSPDCDDCPLDWGARSCEGKGSPYYELLRLFNSGSGNMDREVELALEIANLPLKKEEEKGW